MRRRFRSLARRFGSQCPHCESARTIGIPATTGLRYCFSCGESFTEPGV